MYCPPCQKAGNERQADKGPVNDAYRLYMILPFSLVGHEHQSKESDFYFLFIATHIKFALIS